MKIEVARTPDEDDLRVLSVGIQAFNRARIGEVAVEEDFRFAVFARDENNVIAGGIRAVAYWDWMCVELLWLREDARGQGTGGQLLKAAERFAADNGFYQVRIETTSFQALGFYQKSGYCEFGHLDDFPTGHTTYYLKKLLPH